MVSQLFVRMRVKFQNLIRHHKIQNPLNQFLINKKKYYIIKIFSILFFKFIFYLYRLLLTNKKDNIRYIYYNLFVSWYKIEYFTYFWWLKKVFFCFLFFLFDYHIGTEHNSKHNIRVNSMHEKNCYINILIKILK